MPSSAAPAPWLDPEGHHGSADNVPTPRLARALYRTMVLIRRFEQASATAYGRREIHGTHRSSLGQEAVQVGVCHALRADDRITPGLRSVGDLLARGSDPRRLMSELYGRTGGLCAGRAGALHLSDAEHGIIGGFAVMTANAPIAMGLALAARAQGGDGVVACFIGDRATNQGVFHETMNAACLHHLPILFAAVNNAPPDAATSLEDHTAAVSMAALARAHGAVARIIDGTDAVHVHRHATELIEAMRAGGGPAFLECRCFPLGEPSRAQVDEWMATMSRTGEYEGLLAVKKREIGRTELRPPLTWVAHDPIATLERAAVASTLATDDELVAIRDEIDRLVDDAVAYALKSPEATLDTRRPGVFADTEGDP